MLDEDREERLRLIRKELDSLTKKEVNFDLDTNRLRELTGKPNTHEAYSSLRATFENMRYVHPLYSGYRSLDEKTMDEVKRDLYTINDLFPWSFPSLKACHITTILGKDCDFMVDLAMEVQVQKPGEKLDVELAGQSAQREAAKEPQKKNQENIDRDIDDR